MFTHVSSRRLMAALQILSYWLESLKAHVSTACAICQGYGVCWMSTTRGLAVLADMSSSWPSWPCCCISQNCWEHDYFPWQSATVNSVCFVIESNKQDKLASKAWWVGCCRRSQPHQVLLCWESAMLPRCYCTLMDYVHVFYGCVFNQSKSRFNLAKLDLALL